MFGVARSVDDALARVRLIDASALYSRSLIGLEPPSDGACAGAPSDVLYASTLAHDFLAPLLEPVRAALPCALRPLLTYVDSAKLAPDAAQRFLEHTKTLLGEVAFEGSLLAPSAHQKTVDCK